jgi:hypothetical protein
MTLFSRKLGRTPPLAKVLLAVVLATACSSSGPAGAERAASLLGSAADGGMSFPTPDTTGPRVPISTLSASEAVVSEADGQVIEQLDVRSRVKVVHDDVTVRDVRITFDVKRTGSYALEVDTKKDGTCPTGVVLEHIEIVGDTDGLPDNAKAVYGACPFTLRNSNIHDVGSGVRITNGARIEGNYIHANHWIPGSGSHRSGVGLNGGSDNVIIGNSIDCEGEGCSGALVLYGDFAQVRDVLIQGNLLNTTGSYCTYAGSLESKKFPQASDVHYIGNAFGRKYSSKCGRFGPVAGNDSTAPGYIWRDNFWADTGEPL